VIAVAFSPSVSRITVGRPNARANVSWMDCSFSTLMRSVSRHRGEDGGWTRTVHVSAADVVRLGAIGVVSTGIYSLDRSLFRFVAAGATERRFVPLRTTVSLDPHGKATAGA